MIDFADQWIARLIRYSDLAVIAASDTKKASIAIPDLKAKASRNI